MFFGISALQVLLDLMETSSPGVLAVACELAKVDWRAQPETSVFAELHSETNVITSSATKMLSIKVPFTHLLKRGVR